MERLIKTDEQRQLDKIITNAECHIHKGEDESKQPVYIRHGWGESAELMDPLAQYITQNDKRTTGTLSTSRVESDREREIWLRPALEMANFIENQQNDGCVLVGHSQGAMEMLLTAIINPNKIKGIILVNGAGLIGEDNIFELVARFIRKNIDNVLEAIQDREIRDNLMKSFREGGKYVHINPLLAANEALAIANNDSSGLMSYLHSMGIKIGIVHGVDDSGFPMRRVQKNVNERDIDGFLSVMGGHDDIHLKPEKTAMAILHLVKGFDDQINTS